MKSTTASAPVAIPVARAYVLDTNVLLHDPAALFAFEEHDVYIPMVVLEELDNHKKGVADLARNARQVTRILDLLLPHGCMEHGFSLTEASNGSASGKLHFRNAKTRSPKSGASSLILDKPDNIILACAEDLLKDKVDAVLVTKDINLRVKALAIGVPAQDYRSDRVFSDSDILPTGILAADSELWTTEDGNPAASWRDGNQQFLKVEKSLPVNSFVVEEISRGRTRLWRVTESVDGLSTLLQLTNESPAGPGSVLTTRNDEQTMALSLLHDKEVDCVSLLGVAGTGKTLLALAAGLDQVRAKVYSGIIITRATVPMGEDIGFLPGTEADKMGPWMGALEDCYEVLKPSKELTDMVKVNSTSFMRGRSFQDKFIIVDEAQNLTPKQVRALLTRAGNGSKVVLTGNLAQIDTPYLDEGSSGLAWAVKNLQNWPHAGHLILPKGERSRLASYVEDVAASPGADRS